MAIIISYIFFSFASAMLFITIYKELWHLKILLVRSCQDASACQMLSKYSKLFERYGNYHIFTFFFFFFVFFFVFVFSVFLFFFASGMLFITVYKEIWHLTISLVRSCQSACIGQNSHYSHGIFRNL